MEKCRRQPQNHNHPANCDAHGPRTMLHTFLSFFIVCLIVIGIEGFGVSPDEIIARVNENFNISCSVPRAQGKLNFYDDDDIISESYIKRVNDTFIEMRLAYQRPVKKNLTCRQSRNIVGFSEVIVDERMAPVIDFKCRTHNLTNVHCSFRKPRVFLPIRYRFSVGVNEEPKHQLRLRQDGQGGYSANIKVSQFTSFLENATIALKIEANNTLYLLDEAYKYSLMEILTPNAVTDLKVMEDLTTHSSVFVTFALPKALKNASLAMMFDVGVKVNDEGSEWNKITNPRLQLKGGEGYLVLDQLQYANTNYAMKIRTKSKEADDVDEMWSSFKEISFKTSPKLPETAPKTCDNCFNVMDNGNVVVYWMEVPKLHQNAENFSYLARGLNERGEEIFHGSFDQTSMLVARDLISDTLRIELLSVNELGVSEKFSQISIRGKPLESNKKLLIIRKALMDNAYKISWKPLQPLDAESFTVIWCRQRNELPNQCDGPIKFEYLPANASEFQLHASDSIQFGVAVNFWNKSLDRGLEWAECTAAKSNEIGQVHSLWSSVLSEKSIILHWKLNCVDEPIVVGYNITYCAVDDKSRSQCNEASQSEIVILNDNDELNQYELLNLKSYQLYSISVALMSLTRLGISSAPIVVRTLEGPPTAPRNLRPVKINRHSIDLTWDLPLEVNGESMTYQLWYNDHKVNINYNGTMNETFSYKLGNLESFTNYTITIVACTSDCSGSSDSITLRTAMGEPSVMLQPKLNYLSEGKRILSWHNPLIVGGNLDYFQLKMIPSQSYESREEKVFRINGKVMSCFIEGFKCEQSNVLFAIRGVNIEHREEKVLDEISLNQTVNCFAMAEPFVGEVAGHFYGSYSVPIVYPCQPQMSLVMIASVIITAISMMTSVYLFARLYQRYKEMKDIHIVWPKGLDPNDPSPQVPHRDVYEAVKDFDLIKDHVLTDVEEEEEITEREKFIQITSKPEDVAKDISLRESAKSEGRNDKATMNGNFYQMPKRPTQNLTKSAPTSPERNVNAYTEFPKNSPEESCTEYTKMYLPQKPSLSVDGYMDMTGKLPSFLKCQPSARSDYTLNEVKLFIRDSETNNNGYIGKRASILMDPQLKRPAQLISNGYVGIQPKCNQFNYRRKRMCPLQTLLATALLCCSIGLTESSAEGWTDPSGPIIQLRDTDVRLRCGVNGNKYSSSGLGFYNNSNQQWIDEKYIRVINSSVIEMFLPNVQEQESVILCKLNRQHGISYNDIKIGRYPEAITGLKCLSDDWKDMNCSFEKPYNPVAVQYSMNYRIAMSSQIYLCKPPSEKDPKIFSCYIHSGAYRRANPTFEFMLSGTNAFGTNEQIIRVDNYASVVPAPPTSFKSIKILSDSVIVGWAVSQNLLVFPKPFDYEFLIVSPKECDPEPKRLRFTNIPAVDEAEQPRNFTEIIDLKFANTWYDISIRMRISTAPDIEEMWSKWNKITLPTATRKPDNPPAVDVGSFNIGRGGDVHVYWKQIHKCYQNGANYSYMVTSSNKQFESPNEIHPQEAIYMKDRVNLLKDTTFSIGSTNAVGSSKHESTIVIPGELRRLEGPTKIKKILSNGSYFLSWSPPEQHQELISSYTVFWCVAKSELENKCESSIDFVRRSPSETYFEFVSSQSVNFAVSANSKTSTSGMVWAKCTTVNSNEIGKIRTIWIPRLTSTEIEVEWKLDCMDSGIVAGYQLEYCPYKEPQTLECVETVKKINITGGLDYPKHTLTDLTPYTQYKIIIRMFSNSTMGPPSDPQANTTLEAAPSEVRGLIARNIGNTTAELYWDPPAFLNGVLLFYKVWANGKDYKVNGIDFHTVEIDNGFVTRMNYTLKDLMAYTEYDIAVEACTKECSKPSKTKIKTTIGAPGNFNQPSIDTYWNNLLKNYTSATINWEEPEFKGGELDYYEIKTKSTTRGGSTVEHIVKTRKRDCYIEELCTNDALLYDFSVRAVNFVLTPHAKESQVKIEGSTDRQSCDKDDQVLVRSLIALKQADPHGWYLPGPWSPQVAHSCHGGGFDSKQYIMLMFLMVASLVIVVMVFYSYRKIRDMKDILVQMPPGLEDLGTEKGKKGKDGGNMEKMGTPDILRNVDNISINCEDESGRLLKKSLNESLNGGDCSSSLHSESTRSEVDHIENEDEIEYGEFRNEDGTKRSSDGLQNFIISTTPNKEIHPILMAPDVMPTSTPIVDKTRKPNLILSPKMPISSSGYVSQPPIKVVSPVLPSNSNGNGYVTHSMFNPMQSSGYTPLSAFHKPIMNQNSAIEDKINTKTPIVATTDQEGISGYVTHKQLSDFGHRLQ